ncbi:MAG: hypothetical protein M3R36_07685 [Bacteroidota bacterium]|nr:hypothetical protein [Bacteroidota bacterium]
MNSPFINTSLRSSLGFATSLSTEIPFLRINDSSSILNVDADITYVNGNFQYQNAIQDWASIWINAGGVSRIGTNTASIFLSGVTANTFFEAGMLFKIKEFQKSLFSTSFRIKNTNSTILSIYPFIRSIIDSTYYLGERNIVSSLNPLSGEIDLRVAFAPSKAWGMMSYVLGGYGENIESLEIKDRFNYEFGASANYNLNPGSNIPIAIGAGLKLNSSSPTLEYTKRLTQYYMIQLAYTGREDFFLSFESLYSRIPVNYRDVTIDISSFGFSWAYYF